MNKRHQGLTRKIASIIEGLDDINVSDAGAWNALAVELAKTLTRVPSKPPTMKPLVKAAVRRSETIG